MAKSLVFKCNSSSMKKFRVWRQAIILTNAYLVSTDVLGHNFGEIRIKISLVTIFLQENAYENIVCEMVTMLSRSQCVKRGISHFINVKKKLRYLPSLNLQHDLEYDSCITQYLCTKWLLMFNGSGHSSWRHQIGTFSALPTLCGGNRRSWVNSPH